MSKISVEIVFLRDIQLRFSKFYGKMLSAGTLRRQIIIFFVKYSYREGSKPIFQRAVK